MLLDRFPRVTRGGNELTPAVARGKRVRISGIMQHSVEQAASTPGVRRARPATGSWQPPPGLSEEIKREE